MEHESFREIILLSLYDEIDAETAKKLTRHLSECEACRNELKQLRNLHGILEKKQTSPPGQLLWQARKRLSNLIRSDQFETSRKGGAFQTLKHYFSTLLTLPAVRATAAVAAGLVAGIYLGAFWSAGPPAAVPLNDFDPFTSEGIQLSGVQFRELDPALKQVELSFQASRRFRIEGSLEDGKIQKLLAYALINEQNPGTRLKAVDAFQASKGLHRDKSVQMALIAALKTDDNPAVRQKALSALRSTPASSETRDVLLYVLQNDENPKLRIEAIEILTAQAANSRQVDPEVLGVLKEKADSEENNYIRRRAETFLKEVRYQ